MDLLGHHLGWNNDEIPEQPSTKRALPSTWYHSDELYQLERRAIFSKRWLLMTHKHRFTEAGQWLRFVEAGFSFFLIRDRKGAIRGFHNVCRHRAFPVVTEDSGQSKILACKYHGWTYSIEGNLTKAPGFQDISGFDKAVNGLLPVQVHTDTNGFLWVNISNDPEPWATDFVGVDTQKRYEHFDFDGFNFDHTWSLSGDYNWKTLADNYNECYHCPGAHPDAAGLVDVRLYSVDTKASHVQHFGHQKPEHLERGVQIASTFYFPNACMTVAHDFFYIMRCVPTSAHHCSMEYEVYRHRDASDEDFEKIDSMFKRILSEDKWLCNNAQKNLEAGVFVNGEMHPRMEKGPLYLQQEVRRLLYAHRKLEEKEKREIWPATQILPSGAGVSKEDLQFCASLSYGKQEELAW